MPVSLVFRPCLYYRPSPPYQHPLMNFVWLLLLAIENKKSLSVFSLLVMKYQTSLNR